MSLSTAPILVTLLAFAIGAPAWGTVVGGGGSRSADCLLALDAAVNSPVANPRHVECVDGDPVCDSDATVDGVCSIRVGVCANSTFSSECGIAGVASIVVEHALDNGDPKFDPDFQALQTRIDNEITPPTSLADRCTVPTTFLVPIKGPYSGRCGSNRKRPTLKTLSSVIVGTVYKDADRMTLKCVPAEGAGCDPQMLFASTFDRIQRQVFNQSCALSGCHDSQTQAGGLLLETGASLANLIDVTPLNAAAAAAGWKRIDASAGDPTTSLLYHKITGDLDAGFGEQMPLDRKRLHSALRDVIRLWIENGAPPTGWVPGTEQ